MTVTESQPPRVPAKWYVKILRWLLICIGHFLRGALLVWATLAIYYSNLPWHYARLWLAILFAAFGIWAMWVTRRRRMSLIFAIAFLAVLIWFVCIPASHDRPWRPDVAVMPRAIITGDRVRITGVRDFTYRGRHEFDVRYIEREFNLSRAVALDLYLSFWKEGPVGHTFVSFLFDDGTPPLCISIETRPEVGEGFAPISSMFKQFELIYLVGEEHDLVGSRASHRDEQVFLYQLRASPQAVRSLLVFYLVRINELADQPEWYHLLSNSCTVNIVRYANAAGRPGRFDYRHWLNGWIDHYLYESGWVDRSLPLEELRERSRITQIAQEAENDPDFPKRIRASLPPR